MPTLVGSAPRVSVIITAYKAADTIAETLDSVFNQTFTSYEVIVVNDGSPDTAEFEAALRPYAERLIYLVQANQGGAAARNTAILHARGEWVANLDSDDVWLPEYLAAQMKFLDQNPSLDFVIADSDAFGYRPSGPHAVWRLPAGCRGPVSFEAAVRGEFPQLSSTSIFRRSLFLNLGRYDTRPGGIDLEFFLRAVYYGARVDYLHQVLARKRLREDSLVFNADAWARLEVMALKRVGENLPLSPSERALVERQIAANEGEIALRHAKSSLAERDSPAAIKSFQEANRYFRDWRISLAVMGLRLAPWLATRLIPNRRQI